MFWFNFTEFTVGYFNVYERFVNSRSLYFPAPGPSTRPWPPICIYRPWFPICIYRSWPPICIYQPWPPICIYMPWPRMWLPALAPNLYLPVLAPSLYLPVQVKTLLLLPQLLVLPPPPLLYYLLYRCFSVKFPKYSRAPFLQNTPGVTASVKYPFVCHVYLSHKMLPLSLFFPFYFNYFLRKHFSFPKS